MTLVNLLRKKLKSILSHYLTSMKISVIIPAYNEEDYIAKTLESLMKQTVMPNEIIVVDNNCKDKTATIAKKFGVKVVTEKKQGMIHARNKGFDSARYELIARCDSDVILPTDWIQKILKNFETRKIDALSGPVIYYDSFLKHTKSIPSRVYLKGLSLITGGRKYLVGPNMILTQKIWKRAKPEVTLTDASVHEDVDLSLSILRVGGIIGQDKTLVIKTSSRRIASSPNSFFLEYPMRMIKTFQHNKKKA